jgi:glutamyl-tRNA synthetase
VRTALFNYLLARRAGGRFFLRLEDTDAERNDDDHVQDLIRDLAWLGVLPDAGPESDDPAGPFRQSERAGLHAEQLARLEAEGAAYPCYCTAEELEAERQRQVAAGKPPRYGGHCRDLDVAERDRLAAEGRWPTLRFRVPAERGEVAFDDLLRGTQRTDAATLGDFVIRRADGSPAFLFANAVDDALMGVTHVLRGEDHLSNTPRQQLILEALGLPAPRWGHVGLVTEVDGSPLAKRSGSRALADLREAGFLPEAVATALAHLGHAFDHDELVDLTTLAAGFRPERLSRGPARFDPDQLLYWQRQAVAAADDATLWAWLGHRIHQRLAEADIQGEAFVAAVRENLRLPEDADHWAEVVAGTIEPDPEAAEEAAGAGREYFTAALEAVALHGTDLKQVTAEIGERAGVRGRALYRPLRAALTGRLHGPELGPLLTLMGAERASRRLQPHLSER